MPMPDAESRVAFVIRGVVRQAMTDAAVPALRLVEPASPASRLIERWCGVSFQAGAPALAVSAASKTDLLLAVTDAPADLYPLGDMFATEVAGFAGTAPLRAELAALAEAAGGLARLDAAMRRLLDERRPADAAFADIPHIREAVLARLQATRFRRAHLGVIPKLGGRTIGIDLHI